MPNLKGFNRADKGSQNNLVDFSDDRGSVAVSMGSHDGDEDVETIFDLTAQVTILITGNVNLTTGKLYSYIKSCRM